MFQDADSDDDDGDGDNLFSPQMSNVDSALLSDPAHSIPMSMSANVMSDGPRQEVMSITLPLVSTDDGHLSQAPSPPKVSTITVFGLLLVDTMLCLAYYWSVLLMSLPYYWLVLLLCLFFIGR